ncbi:pseudouridine-5'-phosphatase isoform X1 [Hylaeus anthracinus]|uniref:pseudouridine-5'-phosphatase isoform X1 n=1 Tax=Hylaeus volcanicus TaxID=313075 RepID=UPI0023B7E23C|nr:pseudouridine-5'-phosphatase isoform X1 [Hylaeus volcanicus]XP_053979741.1 pseudouridine-5'-phosphatase isoform X1 [Hylaeus volcanicus]XP_054015259.1 pseudouridine-5'-phosphatase isoform X1 [Hylaeus anthracinus]
MSKNQFNNVTHCIFDMDGLLLDTEKLYSDAFNRITNRYGKEFTWEHKAQTMGFKTTAVAEAVVEMLSLPLTVDEFQSEIIKIYEEIFPSANLMPGAERLLTHLKQNNIPFALATSSSKENFELKTQRWTEVFNLFNHKVLGGSDPDVVHGKPAPDIFLIAAKRFPDNPNPSKCLVFEDAPNGVKAALSAGMQVVMVPDPQLPKRYIENPTLVINSLEEFKPEMFGLPSYST